MAPLRMSWRTWKTRVEATGLNSQQSGGIFKPDGFGIWP